MISYDNHRSYNELVDKVCFKPKFNFDTIASLMCAFYGSKKCFLLLSKNRNENMWKSIIVMAELTNNQDFIKYVSKKCTGFKNNNRKEVLKSVSVYLDIIHKFKA
jgi:hypothetical protein